MTAIEHALQTAGVKLPSQKERLWRVIKDNPGIIASRAAAICKIPASSAAALAGDMVKRGMLTETKQATRMAGPRGSFVMRNVNTYTVHPRMDGFYEDLPLPKKPKAAKPTPAPAPEPKPTPKEPTLAERTEVPGVNVDSLTVAQARALYAALHKMFGGK